MLFDRDELVVMPLDSDSARQAGLGEGTLLVHGVDLDLNGLEMDLDDMDSNLMPPDCTWTAPRCSSAAFAGL